MDATHEQTATDAELIESVAHGDLSAFERLYHLYEKRIYQYGYMLVRERSVAEEVVIETMLAVWQRASSFARTSKVSTWIFGIARHKALDAIRKVTRHQQDLPIDEVGDLRHSGEGPLEEIDRDQAAIEIRNAMRSLSREHQEILRLVFYEELPYEEIAALLKIPVNTVKTRVYYAKQHLKRQIKDLGKGKCE